ncbi:helix-turn-helix transcriptional regulator [Mucilaginibacter sp. Bleaf8]|uniref:helix-turn-helix domain-containing protein n=1 Tax=Mucilaginibacter sp. Bleaf8 TaxID=2834430 RepID=UPI001BCE180A|nr:response regulator transcription factor [Mucilaginibacter sp. Bleaf8]MBS7564785.1 helix-turn-helix transcriptional regulator [Mucilaginibacter sp. Bleaf8]
MRHFKTIAEFHHFVGLPAPLHPLISVVNVANVPHSDKTESLNIAMEFYAISVKRMINFKVHYGQRPFDFNNGIMSFMSPNQVLNINVDDKRKKTEKSGWVIYIHPDFIWNTALAKTIRRYDFWDYSLNEALFLSEKEEATISSLIQCIFEEYQANIDRFSKSIIISHIEALLNYADRFYHRQFITREKSNHQILEQVETLLTEYFNTEDMLSKGLPTVAYLAESLNLSPKYLSSLLKVLTGQNTQQHIHEKLIEKAKEKLSTTELSISEIAYGLGFEHLPSFSKLFKAKTSKSPLAFRASFNRY